MMKANRRHMSDDQSFQVNRIEGLNKFNSAHQKAFWKEIFSHLRGKPVELLSFEDVRTRLRLHEESYRGLQDIPLDKIAGSVGRYREFTRDFLPKTKEMRERWSRVYAVANGLQGYPPIEVYKIGEVYFVRDGNHRVSVARQLDSKTIEAHVTELPTPIDLTADMSMEDIDEATAHRNFLKVTGLEDSRPHHQSLELTEASRYSDLMGHIYLHQYLVSHMTGQDVSLHEAAANWYDYVYRPALTLILKYEMKEQLGARTEGDLYLWMVDHLSQLRGEFGDSAPSRKFSDALIDFLEVRNINVPEDLRREQDDSVLLSRTQLMRAIANLPPEIRDNPQKAIVSDELDVAIDYPNDED